MNAMQSMAMDDEESFDAPMPIPMADKPEYPYGLRICLTDIEMTKLGIDPAEAMQGIGGVVFLHALARITSASMNQMESGDACCRVELQIEDMSIDTDDTIDMAAPSPPKRGLASIYKS